MQRADDIRQNIRMDHSIIVGIIEDGSSVLDLGCGSGEMLYSLIQAKEVRAEGIELEERHIYGCVEKGITVYHRDIENGLQDYPDNSIDYVVLNQIIQEIRDMESLLEETFRVGRRVIVGFPNFAYIKARLDLFFRGVAPVTSSLPYQWYNSPNVHFGSLKDFRDFCRRKSIKIISSYYLGGKGIIRIFPNLFAQDGIFLLQKT